MKDRNLQTLCQVWKFQSILSMYLRSTGSSWGKLKLKLSRFSLCEGSQAHARLPGGILSSGHELEGRLSKSRHRTSLRWTPLGQFPSHLPQSPVNH